MIQIVILKIYCVFASISLWDMLVIQSRGEIHYMNGFGRVFAFIFAMFCAFFFMNLRNTINKADMIKNAEFIAIANLREPVSTSPEGTCSKGAYAFRGDCTIERPIKGSLPNSISFYSAGKG